MLDPVMFGDCVKEYCPRYYHRDGKPVVDSPEGLPAWEQWALMFEDSKARIVGRNKTLYGELLSTVWLGLDHSFGGGSPLIFETMLFPPKGKENRDELQLRYATEREAYDTHQKLLMQCIVPPRLRRFILGVIGGDSRWLRWDEEREDVWS